MQTTYQTSTNNNFSNSSDTSNDSIYDDEDIDIDDDLEFDLEKTQTTSSKKPLKSALASNNNNKKNNNKPKKKLTIETPKLTPPPPSTNADYSNFPFAKPISNSISSSSLYEPITPGGTMRDRRAMIKAELRRLLSEYYGTFLTVFASCGAQMLRHEKQLDGGGLTVALCSGLMTLGVIYALGQISGAHVNPAVTFAFAIRRVFKLWRVPLYIFAQFLGAISACGILYVLFGFNTLGGLGNPWDGDGETGGLISSVWQVFGFEVLETLILVTIVLAVCERALIVGSQAAIAVGLATVVLHTVGPTSAMNPARALAPMIVTLRFKFWWAYALAPFVGSALGVFLEWFFLPAKTHSKQRSAIIAAATGKGKVDEI